jgi:hypothetical protein
MRFRVFAGSDSGGRRPGGAGRTDCAVCLPGGASGLLSHLPVADGPVHQGVHRRRRRCAGRRVPAGKEHLFIVASGVL